MKKSQCMKNQHWKSNVKHTALTFKRNLTLALTEIEGKGEGYDCRGQAHDLFRCIDHCASPQVFNYIK